MEALLGRMPGRYVVHHPTRRAGGQIQHLIVREVESYIKVCSKCFLKGLRRHFVLCQEIVILTASFARGVKSLIAATLLVRGRLDPLKKAQRTVRIDEL